MTTRRPPPVLLALLACAALLSGCDGGDGDGSEAVDQPPVAQPETFPNAVGKSLADLRTQVGQSGPLLAPAVSQLSAGSKNRLSFGLFDRDRAQIARAEVAVYVAPARGGPATGPFEARFESLEVKPQFRPRSGDVAKSLYVADVPFEQPGQYEMLAVARLDQRLLAATAPARPLDVVKDDPVPDVGDRAPATAPALGVRPAVVVFTSAGLCASRVCGPVLEVARQVEEDNPGKAEFLRVGVYRGGRKENGYTPAVKAWNLEPVEPWVFAVDRTGRVAARFEGAFSVRELQQALQKATRR